MSRISVFTQYHFTATYVKENVTSTLAVIADVYDNGNIVWSRKGDDPNRHEGVVSDLGKEEVFQMLEQEALDFAKMKFQQMNIAQKAEPLMKSKAVRNLMLEFLRSQNKSYHIGTLIRSFDESWNAFINRVSNED